MVAKQVAAVSGATVRQVSHGTPDSTSLLVLERQKKEKIIHFLEKLRLKLQILKN